MTVPASDDAAAPVSPEPVPSAAPAPAAAPAAGVEGEVEEFPPLPLTPVHSNQVLGQLGPVWNLPGSVSIDISTFSLSGSSPPFFLLLPIYFIFLTVVVNARL